MTYISPNSCHDNLNSPTAVFEDSPIFDFTDTPSNVYINAEDAAIYWDYPLEYREDTTPHGFARVVRNVTVAFRPKTLFEEGRPTSLPWCHPLRAVHDQRFGASASGTFREKGGNHSPTWLDTSTYNQDALPQVGFHPYYDWQFFCRRGFADIDEANRALSQFARIFECRWARDGSERPTEIDVGPLGDDVIPFELVDELRWKTQGVLLEGFFE